MKPEFFNQQEWEMFFKAMTPAIAATTEQFKDITCKDMIGIYAFRIAYGFVHAAKDKKLTMDMGDLVLADMAEELEKTRANKPKNFRDN